MLESAIPNCRPPLQRRSEKTLERILMAAKKLLRERPLAQITVAQITGKARCCTGSFYQRFSSKEDLLPALYEQYDEELRTRIGAMLSKVPKTSEGLTETVRKLISLMVDQYADERWLYREFALYARTHPEAIAPGVIARRKEIHRLPLGILGRFRDQVRHADPDKAILFAIFLVGAAAREKILFEAPHAAVTNVSRDDFKAELTHAFITYLTTGRGGAKDD
jgi:AcrR family transcriptional regulator